MSSQNDLSIICSINKPRSTLTLILAGEIDMLFEHAFTNALTTHLYKYKITRVSSREEEYSIRERIKFPIFTQSTLRRRSTSANYRLYDFHLAKENEEGAKETLFSPWYLPTPNDPRDAVHYPRNAPTLSINAREIKRYAHETAEKGKKKKKNEMTRANVKIKKKMYTQR